MFKPYRNQRLADTILMVEPYDFDFNEETGRDNEFQRQPEPDIDGINNINAKARAEFKNMVERLRAEGVHVLVLGKSQNDWVKTPDAVFPNNWFSTERDGNIILYPMLAENRRAEKRIREVELMLHNDGFYIRNIINIGRLDEDDYILEGTGSMIIDHTNMMVYAALSKRCHPIQLANFVDMREYRNAIMFDTKSSGGIPIYHTNVMLSIGDQFAVVCSECITNADERERVMRNLNNSHTVIDITYEQMEKHFCGNIIQLRNDKKDPLIVMSSNAFEGFTVEQRTILKHYGRLVPVDIDTIEKVGGGSARCMIAEVFLPRLELAPSVEEIPIGLDE